MIPWRPLMATTLLQAHHQSYEPSAVYKMGTGVISPLAVALARPAAEPQG